MMLSISENTKRQPNYAIFKIASNVQDKSKVALLKIKVDMNVS
jgi:hypothetical protein